MMMTTLMKMMTMMMMMNMMWTKRRRKRTEGNGNPLAFCLNFQMHVLLEHQVVIIMKLFFGYISLSKCVRSFRFNVCMGTECMLLSSLTKSTKIMWVKLKNRVRISWVIDRHKEENFPYCENSSPTRKVNGGGGLGSCEINTNLFKWCVCREYTWNSQRCEMQK